MSNLTEKERVRGAIPQRAWEWFGFPGHFICADRCRFRMCTKVGDYLISTVGDMWIDDYKNPGTRKRETIGAGPESFFETYVFKAGARCAEPDCGCRMPAISGMEIEGERCATAGEAQKLHMKYCNKYARHRATEEAA